MANAEPPAGDADASPTSATQPDSVTRGFLFADLRGFTDFAETHGAVAAADLLARYRILARTAIDRFGGAEIKTEGDSFYVVFTSVTSAVRCGLAITADAAAASGEQLDEPVRVGVGIHAGETIETAEGYVGSPVNIAARICAQAISGEVLVSETVRALTRTLLAVRFEPRGRRQLKGINDPITLYAVLATAEGATPWADGGGLLRGRGRALLIGGAALLAAAAGIGWWALHSDAGARPAAAGLPPGAWTIGLDMPLSGAAAFRGEPVRNAVQLAINDVNKAGGILGSPLTLKAYDDGQDPQRGADNARAMVADPETIAMIGPWGSPVGSEMIPVTNKAGLFECSPSNTLPELTKPRDGALDLRKAYPDRINYVRLAPADDIQAPALASFAFHDLGAKVALVIDDTDVGRDIADGFQKAYTHLGGRVDRRALNPGADPTAVLPSPSDQAPDVVFFGGFSDTGGVPLRLAMERAGLGSVPLLSWDGLLDGSGVEKGSFIQQVGPTAIGSYVAHASFAPPKASFVEAYRLAYGKAPDEYSAAAYACIEVIARSLRAIAAGSPTAAGLREALRAYAVDPSHRYETVLGAVGFDKNGDSIQQFVTFYRVDPSAVRGAGDWVIDKQQDFGPAP
ncbi:MAG: ABC transporter substrate-binding protein [Candidatus Dormibacteraeota bacterium]|nr:ABC transporter substrate-binding protein [Candidatus Dormibacteraeota bacterium]